MYMWLYFCLNRFHQFTTTNVNTMLYCWPINFRLHVIYSSVSIICQTHYHAILSWVACHCCCIREYRCNKRNPNQPYFLHFSQLHNQDLYLTQLAIYLVSFLQQRWQVTAVFMENIQDYSGLYNNFTIETSNFKKHA